MTAEKEILFLTTNDVSDPVRGCDRRSAQLLEHLPQAWRVDAISYDKSSQATESDTPTSDAGTSTSSPNGGKLRRSGHVELPYPPMSSVAPFNPTVYRQLRRFDGDYDVVVASAVGAVLYGLVASVLHGAALVVDVHNVDHRLSLQIGDYPRYLYSRVFGAMALRRADAVLVTSEEDAEAFGADVRQKATVVANGFDADVFYRSDSETEDRVLFFGNMSYEPNREAVEEIGVEIAPELAKRRPDTEIHIAGPNSESVGEYVADCDNVKVVGLVDDIASYVRSSSVVIVPLRSGSGTRLKIIESLACGTPVVSTPKGAEGWPDSWQNLTLAPIETFPEAVGAATEAGYEDSEYDAVMAYSWERQCERFVDVLRGL